MILGIGTDLVEINYILKVYKKHGDNFVKKILSIEEHKFFIDIKTIERKIEWLSGRIAAKEATLKALGLGLFDGLPLQEIEVKIEQNGKPYIKIKRKTISVTNKFHVSITHTSNYAHAVVIQEEFK